MLHLHSEGLCLFLFSSHSFILVLFYSWNTYKSLAFLKILNMEPESSVLTVQDITPGMLLALFLY